MLELHREKKTCDASSDRDWECGNGGSWPLAQVIWVQDLDSRRKKSAFPPRRGLFRMIGEQIPVFEFDRLGQKRTIER